MVNCRLLVAFTASAMLLVNVPTVAEEWSYQFEPYVLASTIEGEAGVGRVTGTEVDVDMSDILEVLDFGFMGHFEALIVNRRQSGDGHIDYFAGVRWWDNDIDLEIDPVTLPGTASAEIDEDWIDVVIGVRWANPVSDKWTFSFRGDIGGLGLESDFTAVADMGFQFKMSRMTELDIRYKALWVDYETGTAGQPDFFSYDTTTHGPIIGVIINF